jgi:hypothetical protein
MIRQNLHSELLKRIREKRRFMQVRAKPATLPEEKAGS